MSTPGHYLLLLLLFPTLAAAQLRRVQTAFTIQEKDLFPEGMAYDPAEGAFYIGSTYKSKIIRISKTGVVTDFVKSKDNGLGEVLGLRVDVKNKHLLACSNPLPGDSATFPAVYRYDLATGKLIKKYEWVKRERKPYFNDLVVGENGDCFVTDSDNTSLYVIRAGSPAIELFLESDELAASNGITFSPDSKNLIVSTRRGLLLVDPITKENVLLHNEFGYRIAGLDGIYSVKNTVVGIQNVIFPYSVNRYTLDLSKNSIIKFELLVADQPLLQQTPTTGAIVGDSFYFIGNSQMENLDEETRKIKRPEQLRYIQILKIKL